MLNQIMTIIVQSVMTILGVLASAAVTIAISYIYKKRDEVIQKVGQQEYDSNMKLAKDIFYRVEQDYKGYTNLSEKKRESFDNYLLQKIPWLTQEELNHFRETVVGKINAELKK